MPRFQAKAEKVLADNHVKEEPIYSFDHAGPHDAAEAVEMLEQRGITQDKQSRLELPSLSPDFHRVIEHVHAIASKAFNAKLRVTEGRRTVQEYKKMYEAAFYGAVHASSVQADIKGLKELWVHVKKPTTAGGSDGNWPATRML
jgi:hypothetical protein